MDRFKRLSPALLGLVVLALVAAVAVVFWPSAHQRTLTAEFPRTVSLYKGSDVKILGIAVGKVDSVTPEGTKVVVRLSYDAKYKLPANVKAVIISPSVVGDRFVQLTPVYTRGAILGDNATLGLNRTAVPLELDQIFGSLNQLNIALGPNGANAPDQNGVGALTRLLNTTARNFGGQGVQFNRTLKNLGRLTQTLADNKDALFGTTRQIEQFVSTLSRNDTTVRRFNDSLASGSSLLAGERQDLAAAMHNLGIALTEVRGFVHGNRALLGSNIRGLNNISKILVRRRNALNET
ncbi:MAG: MCE family protein, partial [Actinomycetota bacterium]|nr:MCE family protein [Actinomycetota bacterium]